MDLHDMDEPTNAVLLTKIEAMTDVIGSHFDENKEAHDNLFSLLKDHNGRLTKVERSWNQLVGAVLFSSVIVVPIILTIINNWITHR